MGKKKLNKVVKEPTPIQSEEESELSSPMIDE